MQRYRDGSPYRRPIAAVCPNVHGELLERASAVVSCYREKLETNVKNREVARLFFIQDPDGHKTEVRALRVFCVTKRESVFHGD